MSKSKISGNRFEAECPICDSTDFYEDDVDFNYDVGQIRIDCYCENCFQKFHIEADIDITDVVPDIVED